MPAEPSFDGNSCHGAQISSFAHYYGGVANAADAQGVSVKDRTLQQFTVGLNAGSETDGMADSRLLGLTVRDNVAGGLSMASGQRLNNHLDAGDPANPVPNRTQVRGNIVRGAGADGILVDAAAEATVLERNVALDAGDDGIHVDCVTSALTGNRAFFNRDLGIEAVPGVTDGGGNRARQNGNPAQCSRVACR